MKRRVRRVGISTEVLSICELDGPTNGSGRPGPVNEKLQLMYFDQLLATLEENPEWSLTIN
jgi:hypothetical protein